MSNEPRKFAAFDVDGTIFRSSLLIELVEELIEAGHFPPEARASYQSPFHRWLDREDSYEKYIGAVVEAFTKNIKGVAYSDFADVVKKLITEKKNRTYVYTRELVHNLKKRGYFLLAISGSPKGVLDSFCHELGFDKVYGRFYELGPGDLFTGGIVDEHLIANKANIIHRAMTKENLTKEGSIAVGDTADDISMLEAVEKPICFNPNEKLYRYAKLNKWPIIVERKDVIYRIN
ncbi:MAG: HAD family phosphatase [Candidatus Vogelbacteria bacterium]|nr:HAD family phosphatase [Candidatus Vogelbacteria bacterium]